MNEVLLAQLALMLGVSGGLAGVFWYFIAEIRAYILKKMLTTVRIDSNEEVYKWVLKYLVEKDYLGASMKHSMAREKPAGGEWWIKLFCDTGKQERTQVEYYPAPGSHYFTYKGVRMYAEQTTGKTLTTGW